MQGVRQEFIEGLMVEPMVMPEAELGVVLAVEVESVPMLLGDFEQVPKVKIKEELISRLN